MATKLFDDMRLQRDMLGHVITSVSESEDAIAFTLDNQMVIQLDAYGDCCSSSWFVLDDIERPAQGVVGAMVLAYKDAIWDGPVTTSALQDRLIDEYRQANSGDDPEDIHIASGFELHTTHGVYRARMANSSNGYYSGSITAELQLNGTHWARLDDCQITVPSLGAAYQGVTPSEDDGENDG